MNARSFVEGAAGAIEIAIDAPASAPRALALVCHPHPLHGGTMDNKVVTTISRALTDNGALVARFNFRGVGASAGVWDEGRGELDDATHVLKHLQDTYGATLPLALAGFSFGAAIAAQLASTVTTTRLVLVAPAVSRFAVPHATVPTTVVHGEVDEVVSLKEVLAWAGAQTMPVIVFPAAGHFFHGQLVPLKNLLKSQCQF